ncbi:hypothetical protein DSO57_1038092 [Entomophthora muscae]|uniref:Uncharacterized protein n=1 Tax=Entomophthora muscae TaxID=34485 RepID=A0ACC2SYW4_9FUNG|nr:hypothetical protein DSO57_1038092 [Entomophthora muscae]
MGKVRRKVTGSSRQGLSSLVSQVFAKSAAVSVFSTEANSVLDGTKTVKSSISKKLKRKIRHDNFVQKIAKPTKKKVKSDLLNLGALRSSLKEIKSEDKKEAPKALKNPFFDPSQVVSKKKRSSTKMKEMQRFNAVVNFSAFKENPIKAVQQHLANTMATPESS